MPFLHLFILCLIQGLTEFLPVSSSGHLVLFPALLGWEYQGLEIDVAVHVGTLLAVFLYFWSDIQKMILETLKYIFSGLRCDLYTSSVALAFILVFATIPAIILGFILKKMAISWFENISVIAFGSIFFGILLYVADRFSPHKLSLSNLTYGKGFIIGCAQALALIPGTSRSGICITAGRLLGFDKISTARFAFLLSIPSILGAATLTTVEAYQAGLSISISDIGIAVAVSMIFGLAAIHFMLSYLVKHGMLLFMLYRIALGALVLFLSTKLI